MRKSVTSQSEKACVAYVQGNQTGTVLAPCTPYATGLVDVPSTITPPYITFTALAPEQMGFDSGIYELKLVACLATQVDDEMDTVRQDLHRERLELLRDMMEDVQAIQAFVNPPASGPDTRTVQDFTLSAIVYEDDQTKMSGRKLETDITYYVCASPSDS
jgi:hypothetical protein